METGQSKAKSIKALFLIQIFSTLSYSVLFSTLVLYLTLGLKFPDEIATHTTASFVAFNYALHLLGGYFGGRFFSFRGLFAIGMILQIIGCSIIAMPSNIFFYWGLAIFLSGCGLNMTCINCMLTQLFAPDDKQRESAFLWNYSGMNIGFLIGFILSGILQSSRSYHILFLLSAFGNLIALIIHLINFKNLADKDTLMTRLAKSRKKLYLLIGFILLISLIFGLKFLLMNAQFSNGLILFTGTIMAFVVILLATTQKAKEASKKLWAYLILAFGSLIFFTLYELAPMGLTLFINRNVNRNILGFIIQPQMVLCINSVIIIVGGPLLSYFYKRLREKGYMITVPLQFTLALVLIGIAFIILPLGIHFADKNGMVSFGWIFICFVLQSIGELCISPIGYAMVGQLVPVKLRGLLMGTWMMIVGIAAALANIFSTMALKGSNNSGPLESNPGFSKIFFILGLSALIASILLAVLIPFLHKLIDEKKGEEYPASVEIK